MIIIVGFCSMKNLEATMNILDYHQINEVVKLKQEFGGNIRYKIKLGFIKKKICN